MYRAKVLASMLAVAAIIVASSPVRAAEQTTVRTKAVSDQPTTTSDVSLTTEFSAASRGGGHGGVSRSSGGGRSVGRSSGSSRSAGRRSSSGKSASSGSGKSKSASGGSKSKSTSSGGTGKTSTGTGKTATGTGTGKTGTGTGTGKLGAGPGKTGTGKTATGAGKTGTGTGKLGAGPGNTSTGKTATGSGTGKTATGTGTGKLGAGPGKTYRDQMGPTNNPTPTNQNAQNPNPPPNNGGALRPQGGGPGIVMTWKNNFTSSLKGSWDPGSIGTGYSVCLLMGMCAAGAPPGAIDIMMAPLSGNQSSAFEGVVNGFKPTDPNNPLSDPVDQGALHYNLNPFNTDAWPKTGPAAVGQ
jgi:hypothetical protein